MRRLMWSGLGVCLLTGVSLAAHGQGAGAGAVKLDPKQILLSARTIHISGTKLFPAEPLEKKLFENEEFRGWGLVMLESPGADLVIVLERKVLTFDFTYRLIHPRTGVILDSGKVIAMDGIRAAPFIANQLIERIRKLRGDPPPDKKKSEKPPKQEKPR